jgi:hypothetical protein
LREIVDETIKSSVCQVNEGDMDLSQILSTFTLISVLIGVFTFIKALKEYSLQGSQKRVDLFIQMRRRFKENKQFVRIGKLLETDEFELTKLDFELKRAYLGFFQEVSLTMNSGLMREGVTYYMFGYYAITCSESINFWKDVNRKSYHWSVFNHFANRMLELDKEFKNTANLESQNTLSRYIKKNFRL